MNDVRKEEINDSAKGSLIVLSGFSGAGKGTVIRKMLDTHPEYVLSISATSRDPRPGEQNGREYHFVTRQKFEEMIYANELIEHTEYCSNYYGTPRRFAEETIRQGRRLILEIEVNGALNIRKQYPDALLVFMTPPSAAELKNRLTGRDTEKRDVIIKRLKTAVKESEYIDTYDYIVINDTIPACADELHALSEAVRQQTPAGHELLDKLRADNPENKLFIQKFRRELSELLAQEESNGSGL